MIYSTAAAGAVGKWEAQFAFHFSMALGAGGGRNGTLSDVGPVFREVEGAFWKEQLSRSFQPSVFLGLVLSFQAISSSWSWEKTDKSVALGRYWRSKPLMFSQIPLSQGAWG